MVKTRTRILFNASPLLFALMLFCVLCGPAIAAGSAAYTLPLPHIERALGPVMLPEHEVSGRITDSTGVALPGVTVYVKENKSIGTTTDLNGRYILAVPENATIVFTMIGFSEQERSTAQQTTFNIVMKPSSNQLGETVVVAFGTQKSRKWWGR